MNRVSTLFLKFVVFIIALATLAICIFVLPSMAADDAAKHPDLAYQQFLFLAFAYISAILFFIALFQSFKLLIYVDANKAFSELFIRALRYIKYCGLSISALVVTGIVALIVLTYGEGEDIAGVLMLGIIITFVSLVGVTLVAVLQKHVQKAVEIKSENDLTV
jgi:hypothetical protein